MTTPAKSTSAKCVCEFQSIADANPVCGSEYAGNINGSDCYNQLPGGSCCGHDAACHAAASEPISSIHSYSYFCNLPECLKRQRDELRDRFVAAHEPMVGISLEAAQAALRALRNCSSPYKGGEWPKPHIRAIEAAIASTQPQDDSEGE